MQYVYLEIQIQLLKLYIFKDDILYIYFSYSDSVLLIVFFWLNDSKRTGQ